MTPNNHKMDEEKTSVERLLRKTEGRMDGLRLAELIMLILCFQPSMLVGAALDMALPGCKDACGNVSIPYPFGIGSNCAHSPWYDIVCNTSFSPPTPILRRLNLLVAEIRITEHILVVNMQPVKKICRLGGAIEATTESVSGVNLMGTPFSFLPLPEYSFVVEGCTGSATMMNSSSKQILAGCASVCPHLDHNTTERKDLYNGIGFCRSSIPLDSYDGLDFSNGLDPYIVSFADETEVAPHTCMYAGLLSPEEAFSGFFRAHTFPTKLQWSIEKLPFPLSEYRYSYCFFDLEYQRFHFYSAGAAVICHCANDDSTHSNPYLPNGCAVAKGCEGCKAKCRSDRNHRYTCEKKRLSLADITGTSAAIGTILLIIGCYWLYKLVKRWKEIRHRAKNFKRNGGLLLQQEMSSEEGVVDKLKIFTMNELEKATDDFNESRIVGEGGQGTVYKGMLMDGQIIAVKKSKQVDECQLEQFANEMVILSRINHRNVVQVLGCCLETDVPLMVYEFIPNGSLYQHIHHPEEGFYADWKMRMRIAVETAEAIAYLHSSSSSPVYHRDIKSSNILLDEKFRAKVSDFGASRTITIEHTHLTATVQGTFGYLDPEYFQTNQFTEKSDVYSFGVVLVELLTSKKPVFATNGTEWRSLVREFLVLIEHSCLFEILDDQILEEGNEKELLDVATLAYECLNLNGKLRPTMREVVNYLEKVRSCHMPRQANHEETQSEADISTMYDAMIDLHYTPSLNTFPIGGQSPCSIASHPILLNTI